MSKLVPCKSCHHQIHKAAKLCPSCGVKSPGQTPADTAKGCLGFIVLAVIFAFWINSCIGGDEDKRPEHAKPYETISSEDFSFPGRKRYQFNIVAPSASNFIEYSHTAIAAAQDKQKSTNGKVIYIFLEPSKVNMGKGSAYAIARYAPDGGGNSGDQDWKWKVEAVDKPFTDVELKTDQLWWSNRDQFQVDGLTDEPKLKAFIAEKLGITIDDVSLPFVNRKNYDYLNIKD